MKVFAGLISLSAANAISNNKAADFDCVMDCYRNVFVILFDPIYNSCVKRYKEKYFKK